MILDDLPSIYMKDNNFLIPLGMELFSKELNLPAVVFVCAKLTHLMALEIWRLCKDEKFIRTPKSVRHLDTNNYFWYWDDVLVYAAYILLFKLHLCTYKKCARGAAHIIFFIVQGVFFLTGPPPKSLKYRKVDLGEVRCI